mgnify:CR=1 FL=1
MNRIVIKTLDDIPEAAREILAVIGSHTLVAFSGDMGAGKTTLIQAVCKEMGVRDVVSSPTFALVNEYFTETGTPVFHFDLYRIEDIAEMYDLGYEDYFFSGDPCLIEWPEKALELMPDDTLFLHIDVMEDGTRIITTPA